MKTIIWTIFFWTQAGQASLDSVEVVAKIVAFDTKNVSLEIAGKNYTFNREKLGKDFRSLKLNENVFIQLDQKSKGTVKRTVSSEK